MVDSNIGMAAIVDVETTGLDPEEDEIIELSIILFTFNRDTGEIREIVDEYTGLNEPSVPIKRGATKVNGLKMDDVEGEYLDDDKIISIIGRAEFIVAHNAKFDLGFIGYKAAYTKPWFCSMNGIAWRRKGFASKALQNLLKDHGINVDKKHRAGDDVKATLALLSQRNQKGQPYFYELIHKKPYYIPDYIPEQPAIKEAAVAKEEPAIQEVVIKKVKTVLNNPISTTEPVNNVSMEHSDGWAPCPRCGSKNAGFKKEIREGLRSTKKIISMVVSFLKSERKQ
ncbi:MAG: exonuclease domain-containing protein [Firmicutes bacterium]|nr:exonuclease domain-containing protein [Bacillota bacterium]